MNLSGADMRIQELQDRLAAVIAERDERSLVADQLSTALHIRNTQLTTVTAERDALQRSHDNVHALYCALVRRRLQETSHLVGRNLHPN